MKYGAFINLLDNNQEDWAQQFAFIQSLEAIDHVEFWLECSLSEAEIRWLREQTKALGVSVIMHAPLVATNLAHHNQPMRQAAIDCLIAAIKTGEQLGAEAATCHSGNVGIWLQREQVFDTLADSFKQIMSATSLAVTLENMPPKQSAVYEPITTFEHVAQVIERCPGLKTTIDVGHCLQNDEDPVAAIQRLKPHIADIHLHDGFINGAAHKALGVGDLKLQAVLDALDGYEHFVTLETIGEDDTRSSWQTLRQALTA